MPYTTPKMCLCESPTYKQALAIDQLKQASTKIFAAMRKIRDLDFDVADDLDKVDIVADLMQADELVSDMSNRLANYEL